MVYRGLLIVSVQVVLDKKAVKWNLCLGYERCFGYAEILIFFVRFSLVTLTLSVVCNEVFLTIGFYQYLHGTMTFIEVFNPFC